MLLHPSARSFTGDIILGWGGGDGAGGSISNSGDVPAPNTGMERCTCQIIEVQCLDAGPVNCARTSPQRGTDCDVPPSELTSPRRQSALNHVASSALA